ncbi:NAD(P)-dependent alcohol dehydrogenase [Demequina oxidasica]|uniref:NAD(P)-dependent alcohol dehydrogenase n=1 Tax=Demequina oxidasica TaxID=676199 RepID=UPI000A0099CA|nr:NAD(P)-dependent alcohol dehydrogenase [Demequina oxidasica]
MSSEASPAASAPTMRAMQFLEYGAPADVIHEARVPIPEPRPDDILVEVKAAGVNPYDWHFYRGDPYMIRATSGLRRLRHPRIAGADFAGVVAKVGENVTNFSIGDRVFGERGEGGALAEFVAVPAENTATMPLTASFEEAAAVPMVALTASSALRDVGKLSPGQSVLVNGASGGVGVFAVQLAKAWGASRVVGVCSGRNKELVLSLGADAVVDYTRENYWEGGEEYDLLVDVQNSQPLRRSLKAVKQDGTYVIVGGGGGKLMGPGGPVMRAMAQGLFKRQRVAAVFAQSRGEDLARVASLIDDGKVTVPLEKVYDWADTTTAMERLESNRVSGKLVVRI